MKKRTYIGLMMALILALLAGLAPRAAWADLTLGANAYLNGSGQLINTSGGGVLLTATSGAGTQADPYIFDVTGNLNMGTYTIIGNTANNVGANQISATWRVTGNVTGTGNFDSHTTANNYVGGHVRIEAGGSIALNRVGTYVSYNAQPGDVYLWAMGTVTVASWIDTHASGLVGNGGSVTIRSEGMVSGQGIAINGNTGGYSIFSTAYINASANGGNVALYCQANITLAAGIHTGPGSGTGGSVLIRGDSVSSTVRAGAVSIGGANGLKTGYALGVNCASGYVTIRATSLQVTGSIDTTTKNHWTRTGSVDIDVLENATIGGVIDTRLLGTRRGTPGFVKIKARRIRVEGMDGSGFSIRTWPAIASPVADGVQPGDADVTLTGVDTSTELYDSANPTNSMTSSIYVAGKINTGYWASTDAMGNVRITAVEVQLGGDVTNSSATASSIMAIRYGVTTHGINTHLVENGSRWSGSGGHNITYTLPSGTLSFTADVPYAGMAAAPPPTPPQIQNQAPTGVMTNTATFNGYLVTNGASSSAVYVAWGQTNGAVSGAWASTNFWSSGAWTNGSYPSTNMTLAPNANYYYTFGATNSATNVVASGYQYLITGEVTVQPTDPTGRVTLTDAAAFTVYRPASCTNEAITVAYTLGGTATNNTHYTNSPAPTLTNGTVTLAAGQTNTVITVYPLNVSAPQQTVVLSLVSSNYAIGSANSATCTLAAIGATYYTSQTGDWTNSATWGGSGPPSSGDQGVVRHGAWNGAVLATTNLGALGNYATITVATNGCVAAKSASGDIGTTIANPITFDGGKLATGGWNAPGGEWTGPITITTNGLISVSGSPANGGSPKLSGKVSGPGGITITAYANGYLTLNNPSNDFAGNVVVTQGWLTLACDHALPTGKVVDVYSEGKISFNVSQTYAAEPPPVVNLYGGSLVMGSVDAGANNLTNALAVNVSAAGGFFNSGGATWAYGRRVTGPIAIASGGTLNVGGSRGDGWNLDGPVSGAGGLRFYVFDAHGSGFGGSVIGGTNNTHSGGTRVATFGPTATHTTTARGEGSLGTGPVTVETNTIMALDKTATADWTLTNTLAGAGTFMVEDGSTSYRLTAGGTVSPGTNTAHTAILRVDGKFAFGKNGGTPSTLAIDVASVGTTPGVNHDQFTIDHPDTTLASSITNCALVVTRVPTPNQMNGLTLTIVSAAGANFSSYTFASVSGLGAGGSVVYGDGSIAVTWTAQTPIINNGAFSNLAATSCDVSGYLSSTGASPTVVRCYWGTNLVDLGYTNDLGTQAIGTVWTSLTNLTSTVKYYYRFYATNDAGEYWSVATSNFTTLGDVYWNDTASGNWNADNLDTWGRGTGNYPKEWLNDHVTIDSHTVTLKNSLTTAGGTAPADITVATNGTLQTGKDAGYAVRTIDSPLTLNGGTLYGEYSPSRTVLNGPVTILGDSVCEPTYEGLLHVCGSHQRSGEVNLPVQQPCELGRQH
jgi:hypothetical protein